MGKVINFIFAGVVFYIIYFMLVPLLPGQAKEFIGFLVVIAAIIYALTLIADYEFPWFRK